MTEKPNIQELFEAVNECQNAIRRSINHFRDPEKQRDIAETALETFRQRMAEWGIDEVFDWTDK